MPATIIDETFLTTVHIRIKDVSTGDFIDTPWNTGSEPSTRSAPIVTANELELLKGSLKGLHKEILSRPSQLLSFIGNSDYEVSYSINGKNYELTKSEITGITEELNLLITGVVGVDSDKQTMYRLQNTPVSLTYQDTKLLEVGEKLRTATNSARFKASRKLIGDPKLSFQIGHIAFDETNLGPDSVVFSDLGNVYTAGTLRSDTDVAIKDPNGRAFLEVDMVFPDNESVNTDLRQIVALFKMTPIVPVGGAAIAAAFLNMVSATEVFQELRDLYVVAFDDLDVNNFLDGATKSTTALNNAIDVYRKQNVTRTDIIQFLQDERSALEVLKYAAERQRENEILVDRETDSDKKKQLKKDLSLDAEKFRAPFLLNLGLVNLSVSTITSLPGALRVRMSFTKFYDAYERGGGLRFIDADGEPTYDITQCQPLLDSIDKIFLNTERASPNSAGSYSYKQNPHYIPYIGDPNLEKIIGVPENRIWRSESESGGHNMFISPDPLTSVLRSEDRIGHSSPVMFKYSSPASATLGLEYIPYKAVLQSIAWSLSNKFAHIPIAGQHYPAIQHMGRGTVEATMSFVTTDQSFVQDIMTMKATMDIQDSADNTTFLYRRAFCEIYNDVLALSGSRRWLIKNARVQNDPSLENTHYVNLTLVSNDENIRDREALTRINNNPATTDTERLWWWLYGAISLYFLRSTEGLKNRDKNLSVSNLLPSGIHLGAYPGFAIPFSAISDPRAGTPTITPAAQYGALLNGPAAIHGLSSGAGVGGFAVSKGILFDPKTQSEEIKEKGHTIFGDFGVKAENPKAAYEEEELMVAWQFIFGYEDGGNQYPGLISSDMFIAAFLGSLGDTDTFRGMKEILGGLTPLSNFIGSSSDADLSTFTSGNLAAAKANADENMETTAVASRKNGKVYDIKEADVASIIRRLRSHFERIVLGKAVAIPAPGGHGVNMYREKKLIDASGGLTPWWITNSSITRQMFDSLIEELSEDPEDNTSFNSMMLKNMYKVGGSGPSWIPTARMWETMLQLILYPNKVKTKSTGRDRTNKKTGNSYGYYVMSNGDERPAFEIDRTWRNAIHYLNDTISRHESREKFSSLFRSDPKKSDDISNLGEDENLGKIDLYLIEHRNNYPDLPLPRYSEIFGDEAPKGSRLKRSLRRARSKKGARFDFLPRLDNTGREVWRKVAPTYLELGIRPDIHQSILGRKLYSDTVALDTPGLATPRAFIDYCDPAFFYYRKSWLNENYKQLVQTIKEKTSMKGRYELTPTGDEGESFDITEHERRYGAAGAEYWGTAKDVGVLKTNLSIGTMIKDIQDATELKTESFREFLAKQLGQWIKSNMDAGGAVGGTARIAEVRSYFEKLRDGKIKRLIFIDTLGQPISSIMKTGPGFTTGAATEAAVLQQRHLKGIETGGSKFYVFNTIDKNLLNPSDPTYEDVNGVHTFNHYKASESRRRFINVLDTVGDLKTSYMRAYPTVKLYFVKDTSNIPGVLVEYIESDMYGYNSIISIALTRDKNDSDVCRIVLTDISGNLSEGTFERDVYDPDNPNASGAVGYGKIAARSSKDKGYSTMSGIKLDIGTNILLKMGYGNDPETLETVFTGSIAEIEPGQITTIVAQSYKAELFRRVNFYSRNELTSGLIDLMTTGQGRSHVISLVYLTYRALVELARVPTLDETISTKYSGLTHFGHFVSLNTFDVLSKGQRKNYKSGLDTSSTGLIDGALNYDSSKSSIVRILSAHPLLGAVIKGAKGVRSWFGKFDLTSYFKKYNDNFMHTNTMKNIFVSDDYITDGFFNSYGAEWLLSASGWECLKEIARYKPAYCVQVEPYGTGATIFMGKPGSDYHYRPLSTRQLENYEKALPLYAGALSSIRLKGTMFKFLRSDDYGYNSDTHAVWRNWLLQGKNLSLGYGGSSFYARATTNLEEYVKNAAAIINETGRAKETPTLRDMETLAPLYIHPEQLPSFLLARTVHRAFNIELGSAYANIGIDPEHVLKQFKVKSATGLRKLKAFKRSTGRLQTWESGEVEFNYLKNLDEELIIITDSGLPEDVFKLIDHGNALAPGDDRDEVYRRFIGSTVGRLAGVFSNIEDLIPKGVDINKSVLKSWKDLKSDLEGGGYTKAGQLLAVRADGTILSRDTLETIYKIKFKMVEGREVPYNLTNNENIFGDEKHNNIAFATPYSVMSYTGGSHSYPMRDGRETHVNYKIFYEYERNERLARALKAGELKVSKPASYTWLMVDKSKDLETIQNYGVGKDALLRHAFEIFFGLHSSNTYPQRLESSWKKYTELIMGGVGASTTAMAAWLKKPNQTQADFISSLVDTESGVLSELFIDPLSGDHNTLKYNDVALVSTPLSAEQIEEAAQVTSSELRRLFTEGRISRRQYSLYKGRLLKVVSLASEGHMPEKIAQSIGFTTHDNAGVLLDYLTMDSMSPLMRMHPEWRRGHPIDRAASAIGATVDRVNFILNDTSGALVSFPNIIDVLDKGAMGKSIQEIINSVIISKNRNKDPATIATRTGLSVKEVKSIIRIWEDALASDPGAEEAELLDTIAPEVLQRGKLGRLDTQVEAGKTALSSINSGTIAVIPDRNVSLYELLLRNADEWKLFLVFLAKWIRKNGTTDDAARNSNIVNAYDEVKALNSPPDIKPFSQTHYITSGNDIVENSITASMSEMANNVLLITVKDVEVKSATDLGDGKDYWQTDEENTDYVAYPRYQKLGVDFHPLVKPELRKQRVVVEKNAATDEQRAALLINHMAEAIRPMYRGHLKVIGRNIKPYDKIVLFDATKDMFGIIEVERAIHAFDAEMGWTTTIIPCAWVVPLDATDEVKARFDTSNIDTMLTGLKAFDWLLDGLMIISVVAAFFTAGTSLGATAALWGLRGSAKKAAAIATRDLAAKALAKTSKQAAYKVVRKRIAKEGLKNLGKSGYQKLVAEEMAKSLGKGGISMMYKYVIGGAGNVLKSKGIRRLFYASLLNQLTKTGFSALGTVSVQMQLKSNSLPVNVYCLTRGGQPMHAGLDRDISRYIGWTDRLGYNLENMWDKVGGFFSDAFALPDFSDDPSPKMPVSGTPGPQAGTTK